MSIDLYYDPLSPPARAVIMTAKMAGVELNLKRIDILAGEHLQPAFMQMNPQHTVPLLNDNGFILTESRAICAYLVQKYSRNHHLLPKIPKLRAAVDERLYFDIGVFYSTFASYYYPVLFNGSKLDPQKQKSMKSAHKHLNSFLENEEYVAGDHLTIADISMLAGATTMEAFDENIFNEYPNIKRWIGHCKTKITNYDELNQAGADIFGRLAKTQLAKLDQN